MYKILKEEDIIRKGSRNREPERLEMIHTKILERKNIKTKNYDWIKQQTRYTVKKKKGSKLEERFKEITHNFIEAWKQKIRK